MSSQVCTKFFKINCEKNSVCNFSPFFYISFHPLSFINSIFYFISGLSKAIWISDALRKSSPSWLIFHMRNCRIIHRVHWVHWVHWVRNIYGLYWWKLNRRVGAFADMFFEVLYKPFKLSISLLGLILIFALQFFLQVTHIFGHFLQILISLKILLVIILPTFTASSF